MTTRIGRASEPWRTVSERAFHVTPWLRLREEVVRTHTDEEITLTFQDHPGCVLIVATTLDRRVLLLRHYRHVVKQWCWELPAGRVEANKEALACAKAELLEEAGAAAERWTALGSFFASTGSSNERAQVFLATGAAVGENAPERSELIEVHAVELATALELARNGGIQDGPSALALLRAEQFLAV